MPPAKSARFARLRQIIVVTVRKFLAIDGAQRAAAFAYYAFFSLLPIVVLFVTIGTFFADRDLAARKVIGYVENFAPLEAPMRHQIFDTINGVVKARGKFSTFALLILAWGALQFFKALIRATNRAWEGEMHNWWQMPLKSLSLLLMMGTALALGIGIPIGVKTARLSLLPAHVTTAHLLSGVLAVAPVLVLFYALCLFYRFAPRRPPHFSQVWVAALGATLVLRTVEFLFVFYLRNFSQLNAIYGAFGGIMALLLWIYLSGCVIVFGACLSAAQAEVTGKNNDPGRVSTKRSIVA